MKTGDRELVVMRYFQDQTYPEIARKLGVSEPALRKRMSRALEGIGRRLASRGVGTPARPLLVGAVGVQAETRRKRREARSTESPSACPPW